MVEGHQPGTGAVLSKSEEELRDRAIALLARVEGVARVFPSSDGVENELRVLRQARQQLETLFLLVVVGEFNSGKSAFINALVGEPIMPEGVTPTTAMIHLLVSGDEGLEDILSDGVVIHHHPAPFLREINVVDTPGANAIIREHEAISQRFVPRSDLVLFVTSADRPFSESERGFLEEIRNWGKKIVFVLNKIDLLESDTQVKEVVRFISDNAQRLLGIEPLIFPISAKLAERRDPAGRFQPLRDYIMNTLDEKEKFRLKVLNPLGVAERLLGRYSSVVEDRLSLLASDALTIDRIDAVLEDYDAEMRREFGAYVTRVENIVHRLNERADRFFDEYIRIGRVIDLMRSEKTREAFQRDVVADTERQIDDTITELIDWMVQQDFRAWESVRETLDRRALERYRDDMVGEVGSRFASDRQTLITQVARQAELVVNRYDQHTEATLLATNVRSALAQTAVVQAGAVSLGAIVVAMATTAAMDVTGILAAATVAGLGLFILPARKRSARNELRRRSAELERQLADVLGDGFEAELGRSIRRIRDAIAPYTRFVATERTRLEGVRTDIADVTAELRDLRSAVSG
ncbi:MAG: dynamin family protein [Thermomicrobiales bacterium]